METKLLMASSPAALSAPHVSNSRPNYLFPLKAMQSNSFACLNSSLPKKPNLSVQAASTSIGSLATKKRVDETDSLTLEEHILKETEKLHGQVGRFSSPDEHPFFPDDVPEPVLPPLHYPQVLHPIANSININSKVWEMYFRDIIPRLVKEGDDGNYGSTAVCDTMCLQALSKRIHYGKFVAECKFQSNPKSYEAAIIEQNRDKVMALLTFPTVEEAIIKRVEMKAKTYGQEVTLYEGEKKSPNLVYKIKPTLVADLYGEWIMPMTKEVQVEYLLRRLD
ncbi:hypothetical protein ACFX1Z_023596 [Malus domestica]